MPRKKQKKPFTRNWLDLNWRLSHWNSKTNKLQPADSASSFQDKELFYMFFLLSRHLLRRRHFHSKHFAVSKSRTPSGKTLGLHVLFAPHANVQVQILSPCPFCLIWTVSSVPQALHSPPPPFKRGSFAFPGFLFLNSATDTRKLLLQSKHQNIWVLFSHWI